MRVFPILLPLALAAVLCSCGNPDYGKIAQMEAQAGTVAKATSVTSGPVFGACQPMATYFGTDATTAQTLSGATVCPGTGNLSLVRLKVSSLFPANVRACLVPIASSTAYQATCFTISGQEDIQLTTTNFRSLALVYESSLASYTSYLYGQSLLPPPYAYANVR